jgi:radical SAM protein with 4Fe4S-binding SPASM domain
MIAVSLKKIMLNKIKQPTNAVIAVTYKCNSRCKMCNIWQKPAVDELKPEEYLKLPKSLDDINITGGEPFLRDDLMEILDNIFSRCNPKKLVISSNGFLTEKIIEAAKEILKRDYWQAVTIAISLDGIGSVHDAIRGISGAYNMVLKTITALKNIGFNNIGVGFTFISGNENEYEKIYNLSKELNLNFGATIAHNAENYFSTGENKDIDSKKVTKQINLTIKEKINSLDKKELGKCYYLNGLAYYSRTHKSILPCEAMSDSFFLDPEGYIYPCNILANQAGNIKDDDFDKIWTGEKAARLRCQTKNCPNPCWMVCTGKPAIKKHWLKAGLWILKAKAQAVIK